MAYRLALDIGANSIGWCLLDLNQENTPAGLLDLGVRVHPDGRNPKDQTSLAAARRAARAMRRNRDRYLRRRANLLAALTRFDLMPPEEDERRRVATLDPYALRAEALRRKLLPTELGRVLFHLNQHRGFKSNRRVDRGSNESGLIRDAVSTTRAELARTGQPTLGGWLAMRHAEAKPVRVRLAGTGKTAAYPFYPQREMIEEEFETIWQAQSAWNPNLTATMRDTLHHIIFHQRPLRTPPVGKCWLEPGEPRASRALPTAQRFRIAQTLAHLRLALPGQPERPLSEQEHSVLLALLYQGRDQSLDQIRKNKKLGLPAETDFNTREEKLPGCATSRLLAGKEALGPIWHDLPLATQDAIVLALLEAETEEEALHRLRQAELDDAASARALKVETRLADGHASLSALAMGKILPWLEKGQTYADAVQAAGYHHHSDRRTGEIRDRLPYYGEVLRDRIGTGTGEPDDTEEKRLGRAPNPTVHVALNELRRVVNTIIERHGPPAEIVVETLRELGRSKLQRKAYEEEQKKNRDANDRRRKSLAEWGLPINADNLMRLRLWEEQALDAKDRVCPYTGTLITPRMALSDEIEVDHILPFSVSLDDSATNRILVTREANRAKSAQTPFEAFGHRAEWPAILERSQLLPPNKRWRFRPDAREQLARNGDFLARHLTDSATIARWATEYLQVLAPGKVWSVPGRLTALLRHAFGLNSASVLGKGGPRKDRADHRHHAIDAVVIGLSDRSMLQRVTRAAKAAESAGTRLMLDLAPPWEGFVADVAARARTVTVSHKPDTGWQGALHNDTNYGIMAGDLTDGPNVVLRRPLDTLAAWSPEDARKHVRDPVLAEQIANALENDTPATRKAALAALTGSADHIVRRVRTVETLKSKQVIADRRTGRPYRAVKLDGNHRAEIWHLPDGSRKLCVVPVFEAAQIAEAERLGRKIPDRRPHPAAKLLMQLHKDDMVAFGIGPDRIVLRVVKMRDGQIALAGHSEGGNLKSRDSDRNDPFKYILASLSRLERERARKIQVLPDGRIRDPGPVL